MFAVLRLVLATLTLAAIGQQLVIHIRASYNVLNFFSYFTNLSNLFAACVLLLSVFRPSFKRSGSGYVIRYMSTVNMAVVGIVFALLLRDVDLGALLPWVNFVLHYVMPLAIVLDWLLKPPTTRLQSRHLVLALVFPVVYLAYVVLRGANVDWYPYPFLNPANVGGYGGVALYGLGIAVTFLLVAWVLLAAGNRLAPAKSHTAGS